MRILVAVFEPTFWTLPRAEVERLSRLLPDHEVVQVDTRDAYDRELPRTDVLIATRMSADQFRQAARLQWVHSTAAGIGPVLSPEFIESAIPLTNARGLHAEPIAEHAITLMLALRRSLDVAAARQQARVWAQREIYDRPVAALHESTVAVIGLGAIGSRVAQLAAGLGMTVIGVRKHVEAPPPAGVSEVLPADRLLAALARADVVILALPHTGDTKRLIGEAELAAMRPHSLLINVARGQLVDDLALAEAITSGRIGGAGLDAFVPEPLPDDSPLWRLPHVLITPHTAAFGGNYWRPTMDLFVDNLRRFQAGEPLMNRVDKNRGY